MQDGMALPRALKDALYSETASITVMEITAIVVDLILSVGTHILHPLFWLLLQLPFQQAIWQHIQ